MSRKSQSYEQQSIRHLIKVLRQQIKINKQEMHYHAKGACRRSFEEAAYLDTVNDALDDVIEHLQMIRDLRY